MLFLSLQYLLNGMIFKFGSLDYIDINERSREQSLLIPKRDMTGLAAPNVKWEGSVCKGKKSTRTFKKYVCSRFLCFDPTSRLVCPCSFFSTPSPTQGTFVLARTHPLPLNFYTCEIDRKLINNEYEYLCLSLMCLLRSHSGISI